MIIFLNICPVPNTVSSGTQIHLKNKKKKPECFKTYIQLNTKTNNLYLFPNCEVNLPNIHKDLACIFSTDTLGLPFHVLYYVFAEVRQTESTDPAFQDPMVWEKHGLKKVKQISFLIECTRYTQMGVSVLCIVRAPCSSNYHL